MPTPSTPAIGSVKLPNGNVYYLKDNWAREKIGDLGNITRYLGITTTPLTDGSTTNPIVINGEDVTARAGDVAIYQTFDGGGQLLTSTEFIFDGTSWQEFGNIDHEDLGAFAYVSSGYTTVTPSGTVSAEFSGTSVTLSSSYTPSGSVSVDLNNITVPVELQQTISTITGITATPSTTGNYTPSGSVTVTLDNSGTKSTNISTFSTLGTLPNLTLSNNGLLNARMDASVSEQLELFFDSSALTFDAGTLPSYNSSSVTVITSVGTTVSNAIFNGTSVQLDPATATSTITISGSAALSGTASGTFTGESATISIDYTPSGTIENTSFNGTASTYIVYPGTPSP